MTAKQPCCPCGAYNIRYARNIGHTCVLGDMQPLKYLKPDYRKHAQARALRARGLTYRAIGAEMGISFQRAYQLIRSPHPSK